MALVKICDLANTKNDTLQITYFTKPRFRPITNDQQFIGITAARTENNAVSIASACANAIIIGFRPLL